MYVIGIKSQKVRQALLKEEDPTLETAEKLILAAERLEQDVRHFGHPLKANDCSVDKIQNQSSDRTHRIHNHFRKSHVSKHYNRHDPRSRSKSLSTDTARTFNPCETCGSNKHMRSSCKFRDYICNYCTKKGHLEKVCRQKKTEQLSTKHITSVAKLNALNSSTSTSRSFDSSSMLGLDVNGSIITFEIDTGSSHAFISKSDWLRIHSPTLSPSPLRLKCYSDTYLAIIGECSVSVTYDNQVYRLKLIIVQDAHPPLLGLQWIRSLQLDLNRLIHQPVPDAHSHIVRSPELDNILQKYRHVLNHELGHCTKMKAHIELTLNVSPKFYKPRPFPFAYLDRIKEEITRKVTAGILERVDSSLWAAPIVPVQKPNGAIRICGDFKVTINPHTIVDQHPIPSIDELLSRLRHELDESSKDLVLINTPLGLYKYNRMPFGISGAPAIFQRLIDQVILDIPHCVAYLDDLLITGPTEATHLHTLDQVLNKLADYGFTCNPAKCVFFQDSVSYLGFRIDKHGKTPDPTRVDAITRMPPPKNVKELEAFVGKINYYRQFISNFSAKCKVFNLLRKKNARWNWTMECQTAFTNLLDEISTATTLVHFDDQLPIILATDASDYGIGAVIMHRYPHGLEKPIAFASKTLTDVETKYSQIEKEGLSIIFGVKKFHQYLAGRSFELVTDHRPLLSIFNPAKGIPTTTANRLQRWALFLMGYNYVIHFKPTAHHANADALSRLPIPDDHSFVDTDSLQVNFLHHETSEAWLLTPSSIANATSTDSILKHVKQFIQSSWPSSFSKKRNPELVPYFTNRVSLSMMNDCIMKQNQVVIPSQLQKQVLRLLHKDHLGIVKMKQVAREYCWWPSINLDIKQLTQSCDVCRRFQTLPRPQFQPWDEPHANWSRIHVDFAGPFWNSKWLVIVDAKSKYPFVIDMQHDTTASHLIHALEQVFDFVGPPATLVSDNGPPFTSFQMSKFYEKYGISHTTTAPYHPVSNGLAERFVRSFKDGMLKQQNSGCSNKFLALRNVLRSYRWSPHTSTNSSPANLFFQHSIRTAFDVMKPVSSENSSSSEPKFSPGQLVWTVTYQQHRRSQWNTAIVVKPVGSMLYHVRLSNGDICKRHQNQLRLYYSSDKVPSTSSLISDLALPASQTPSLASDRSPSSTSHYPQRIRRPPDRYSPS
ncbi:unnamed protein product [Adineta ricciae]|uniref:RNA-directed DNA polymerase n=2 Tax=Adineta ricciae TaxID=249248 RepID=A0A816BC08_ADIRI|nr:unnamed protein product [Adineta ricciae]